MKEWLEYPENQPESGKRYWITVRVQYKIMEGTPNQSFVMQNNVLMADFYTDDFYYIGMDGAEVSGEVLAFMPVEDEPEPYGGENYIQVLLGE